jgi:hypothetical protein
MPVEWERIKDGLPEDFRALDGDEIVGRVYPARAAGRALVLDDDRRSAGAAPRVRDERDGGSPRRRRSARGRGLRAAPRAHEAQR